MGSSRKYFWNEQIPIVVVGVAVVVYPIGSNNSFIQIENKYQVYKIAKFEFQVAVHYHTYGEKAPSRDLLTISFDTITSRLGNMNESIIKETNLYPEGESIASMRML